MAGQQTLTEAEMSLLITLRAISDFNKDNPGNIPEGGIGEVVVSNGLMDPDELDELSDSLIEKGLINVEYLLTTTGEKFVAGLDKGIFKKVCEKLKSMAEKVDGNEVRGWIDTIANVIMAYASIAPH